MSASLAFFHKSSVTPTATTSVRALPFTMSKILAVFGASGNQGGSVIRTVLADPTLSKEFRIRAVTRDESKASIKELAERGVEIVKARTDM